MNTSSIQEGENFVCPLCNIDNRAAAKYCRRCGVSRSVLSSHLSGKSPSSSSPALEKTLAPEPEALHQLNQPNPEIDASAVRESAHGQIPAEMRPENVLGVEPVADVYTHPVCPSCDTLVRTSDRFCCWCGEVQPTRPMPLLKTCPECTQSLPGRANYCFSCGRNVGANERLRMRIPTELFREESSEFFPTFDA